MAVYCKPFLIGDMEVVTPLVLAPMAGVSDSPFRRIVKEHGCGLLYGEMVSALGLRHDSDRSHELLQYTAQERPLAMQIFGSDASALAEAARRVEATGVDMVDINCGCPVPKVVKTGAGSALMRQPALLGRILQEVRKAVQGPLSIKIRKGWNDDECNAVSIARLAVEEGVDCIAVHGRTRSQAYRGAADWYDIARVKQAVPVPVIGNGDAASPQSVERMLEETGCDAVMIGRAAMGNPWIFSRTRHYLETGQLLPPPTPEERAKTLLEHLTLMVEEKGEALAIMQMRKHAGWYIREEPGSARVRGSLVRANCAEDMRTILEQWLAEVN